MSKIEKVISTVKELFKTRSSEAQIAWEKEQKRVAVESVDKIPVGDVEILMDNSAARHRFMHYFNVEKRLGNRLDKVRRKSLQEKEKTSGVEDPTHDLQTEF